MKKFLGSILKKLLSKIESVNEAEQSLVLEIVKEKSNEQGINIPEALYIKPKKSRQKKIASSSCSENQEIIARDFTEMMELPFLALSMRRITPIVYEDKERGVKVRITAHREHFLASIYDWDIIVFVAGKMQQILNHGSDIPPRTMTFPRHELLKAVGKYDERKQQKDIEKSLARLQMTGIETTIRNKDYYYKGGFGFLDSWGYTKRKDVKEIHITLSQWLYDGICAKGKLLKVSGDYFNLTSGIKRFLYRTARKHVGNNENPWEFSIEKLYAKSGSEQDIYNFKSDLKVVVQANDLPEYDLGWIVRNRNTFVSFKKKKQVTVLEEDKTIS